MRASSNGRVRRSAEEWRAVVSRYEASDLGPSAFCQAEQVGLSSLMRWRRKLSATDTQPGFVELTPARETSPPPGFVDQRRREQEEAVSGKGPAAEQHKIAEKDESFREGFRYRSGDAADRVQHPQIDLGEAQRQEIDQQKPKSVRSQRCRVALPERYVPLPEKTCHGSDSSGNWIRPERIDPAEFGQE